MSNWYERTQKHAIAGIDDKLQDLGFEITNRRGSSNWTAEKGPVTVKKHSSGDGTGFVVLVGGTKKKKFSYFDKKEVIPYVKNLSEFQRTASLTENLIKLGQKNPELRDDIRPVLDRLEDRQKSSAIDAEYNSQMLAKAAARRYKGNSKKAFMNMVSEMWDKTRR